MPLSQKQIGSLSAGLWLIGLGVLFATGYWWPGILFVLGATSILVGLAEGKGWLAFQGALWSIGVGVWAIFHYNMAVLMVMIGLSVILGAFIPPPGLAEKPPRQADTWLE